MLRFILYKNFSYLVNCFLQPQTLVTCLQVAHDLTFVGLNIEKAKIEDAQFMKRCISVEVWGMTKKKRRTGLAPGLGSGMQPDETEWENFAK